MFLPKAYYHVDMEKLDLKRNFPDYFKASANKFSVVKLPAFNYFMVDGCGDPNLAPEYVEAIELLYGVSYTLKFMSKNLWGQDYVVPPLEGLWWANDMKSFEARDKASWNWTMMIMVPAGITKGNAAQAVKAFREKKPEMDSSKLRFESLKEGLSIQVLHIGPYDAEGPILSKLHHDFMPKEGFTFNGKHHEIYLSDPRKSDPAKLKTILRQPVVKG